MKGQITVVALSSLALALLGTVVALQLTVHDPHHLLLSGVVLWCVLALALGVLIGHGAHRGGEPSMIDDD